MSIFKKRIISTDTLPLFQFDKPLPFKCIRRITSCKDGFFLNNNFYINKKEILFKNICKISDPVDNEKEFDCFKDKYNRSVVHFRRRVPCFDSSDYLYDWRFWEYFYYVNDLSLLDWVGLVCFFGDENTDNWYWFVYEDIINFDGSNLGNARLEHHKLHGIDLNPNTYSPYEEIEHPT